MLGYSEKYPKTRIVPGRKVDPVGSRGKSFIFEKKQHSFTAIKRPKHRFVHPHPSAVKHTHPINICLYTVIVLF